MKRMVSFAPGPSMLPREVLAEYRANLELHGDSGLGILELGHRSHQYRKMYENTIERLRTLIGTPEDYELLLMHGGARFQFAMLPANLLPDQGTADYIESGHFAAAAAAEAEVYGDVHVRASSRPDGYLRLPNIGTSVYTADAHYVHYTSNNTEMGTQFRRLPQPPPGTWLACDASSDLLTRPFDIRAHGCIYATSHKNLGTAGVALVILHRDLLEPVRRLPDFLSYRTHVHASSRLNTPPISAVYILSLMTRWTADQGGVGAMQQLSAIKSKVLYELIDSSDFYRPLVAVEDRSTINITFAGPTPELESRFQQEAKDAGLMGLWGYRKVGHLRASLFNAVSLEDTNRLAEFMKSFAHRNRRKVPARSIRKGTLW